MKCIAVTDDRHSVTELVKIIVQIQDYVDFVHIREKGKSASELSELLDRLIEIGVTPGKNRLK
ncbi:hypothetical protein [Bacillus sp. T3]|uniref:hypothetical protein n=1 Tax=Bacillus sp. T3 TaxID=467262 RepID=UPI002981B8B1|nr:hypothetical protein [Bacillus sp. T3]